MVRASDWTSVVNPELFIPDKEPTSEKFRIQILIRIFKKSFLNAKIPEFAASSVILNIKK